MYMCFDCFQIIWFCILYLTWRNHYSFKAYVRIIHISRWSHCYAIFHHIAKLRTCLDVSMLMVSWSSCWRLLYLIYVLIATHDHVCLKKKCTVLMYCYNHVEPPSSITTPWPPITSLWIIQPKSEVVPLHLPHTPYNTIPWPCPQACYLKLIP